MTAEQGWGLLLRALAYLGGGAALTMVISAWISKLVADWTIAGHKAKLGQETERLKGELAKDTETHKLQLKKQEMLFNKQVEAVGAFIEMHQKLRPGYSWPDKDWGEACAEAAENFGDFETKLEKYRQLYSAVLDKEARKLLKECIDGASINKFAAHGGQYGDRREAEKAAGEALDTLEKLEEYLIDQVQN